MAEKLDLDALEHNISLGDPLGDVTAPVQLFRQLIARIRAFESRASNAGGAVAEPIYQCRQGDGEGWQDCSKDRYDAVGSAMEPRAGVKPGRHYRWGRRVLYTHPAPASKEPVADERAAFEAWAKNKNLDLTPFGKTFDSDFTSNAWDGWQARAALATAQTWQPIETAPKDGACIDLWIGGEFPRREPDCYWGLPHHECGEMGSLCDSDWHSLSEGWVGAYNMPISDFDGGPTHWMPHPAAPAKPEGV